MRWSIPKMPLRRVTAITLVIATLALAWLLQPQQPRERVGSGAETGTPPRADQAVSIRESGTRVSDNGLPWVEADPAAFAELPPAWDKATDARLLRLDPRLMREIGPGGELEIPIPQLNATFTVVVERVETRPSGSLSVRGHIDGDRRFGFVLTAGETSTFATIGTPRGIYNLAGSAELAWIVAQRELDRQLDPSKPDYVVVLPEDPQS